MAIYKTTSSQVIIRKVMRDLAPEDPNWIHDAVEWIGEALEHIGASAQLEKKTCLVKIEDHKGALPNDMYYLEQVALNDDQMAEAQLETTIDRINQHIRDISDKVSESDNLRAAQFAGYKEDLNIYNPSLAQLVQDTNGPFDALQTIGNEQRSLIRRLMADAHVMYSNYTNMTGTHMQTMETCTGSFTPSDECPDCNHDKLCYYTESDRIKTSFKKGTLTLAYKAFPTDHDCYPLVPDSVSYKEAMFWYIFKKMLLRGMQPKNGFNYMAANQQWQYYCTQARNEAVFPDIPQMESFMNQWVRLIPNINRSEEQFVNLGTREDIYRGMYNTYGTR